MKFGKLLAVVAVILAGSVCAFAQENPNEAQALKPYDSWHGGDLDSVSLINGGLSLHLPLASFPQRGNLDLGFFVRFSNKQWRVYTKCTGVLKPVCTSKWVPVTSSGAQIVSSVDWVMQGSLAVEPQDPNMPGQPLYDWSLGVSGPDGGSHQFGGAIASFSGPLYPLRSLDATGILHPNAQTVIFPNGTVYSYPNMPASGNTFPFAGDGS